MADNLPPVTIPVAVGGETQATAALTRVQAKLSNFTSGVQAAAERIGQSFGVLTSGLGTLAGLFAAGSLVKAAHSFHEVEVSVTMLEAALRRAGVTSKEAIEEFLGTSSALAKLTGTSSISIREVQRLLLTMGASASETSRLTPLVLDLASAMGIEAYGAARLLGAALDGEGIKVGRLNIVARDFNDLVGQLQHSVGGAAAEAFKAQGGWGQMELALKRTKFAIGEFVSEPITEFLGGLATGMEKAAAALREFRKNHEDTFNAITHTVAMAGEALGRHLDKIVLVIAAYSTLAYGMKGLNAVSNVLFGTTFATAAASWASNVAGVQALSTEVGVLQASFVGVIGALSALVAAIAVAVASWKFGSWLKDINILGDTIENRLIRQILRLQYIWLSAKQMIFGDNAEDIATQTALKAEIRNTTKEAQDAAADADKRLQERQSAGAEGGKTDGRIGMKPRINTELLKGKGQLAVDEELLVRGRALLDRDLEEKRIALDTWRDYRADQLDAGYQLEVVKLHQLAAEQQDQAKAQIELEQALKVAHEKHISAVYALDEELAKKRQALRDEELRRELKKDADELEAKRQGVQFQRDRDQGSFRLTSAQKRSRELSSIDRESGLIDESMRGLETKRAGAQSDSERDQIDTQMRGLQSEKRGLGSRRAGMMDQADPNSIADQWEAAVVRLDDKLNTFAEGVANVFSSVIQGAVDGIAGSIEGLIKGTMDWSDALRNIASTLVNSVVQAIARMFAEWIIKMTLLRALESMFSAQRKAQTASELPGNVANSAAAAGGSWGVSSYIGLAAFLALIGVALALGGAFAKGGRPPVGRMSLVGEEGPELFVPDQAGVIMTSRVTSALLGKMKPPTTANQSGRSFGTPTEPAIEGQQPPKQNNVHVVMVDDRNAARDYLRTADGEAHIVDVVRRNQLSIGVKA